MFYDIDTWWGLSECHWLISNDLKTVSLDKSSSVKSTIPSSVRHPASPNSLPALEILSDVNFFDANFATECKQSSSTQSPIKWTFSSRGKFLRSLSNFSFHSNSSTFSASLADNVRSTILNVDDDFESRSKTFEDQWSQLRKSSKLSFLERCYKTSYDPFNMILREELNSLQEN